ncbi:MAG: VTT domain-containing protein [Candidatus Omnitrophica bacterium]|nr:VTT domain-containing protein [Candidatus Omnitrophota bacterium]
MGTKKRSIKSGLRFLILILFLLLTWLIGKFLNIDFNYYKNLLHRFPLVYSGIIFICLYSAITFFVWLAKDIFKVIGAVLFGPLLSTIFIYVAEIINASVLFNLSRVLGRDFVRDKLRGGLESLDRNIAQFGFWGIFVLRIVPLVPYRFLDLAAGLTKISFSQYILAVILGSPVRIFWLQFILSVLGESVFKKPTLIIEYFNNHPMILIFSFIYALASFILAIFLKRLIVPSKDAANR